MLTRSAFALVVALTSASGALAAPLAPAQNSASEPTLWGFRYTPPQEEPAQVARARGQAVRSSAHGAESRQGSGAGTVWGFPYTPPERR